MPQFLFDQPWSSCVDTFSCNERKHRQVFSTFWGCGLGIRSPVDYLIPTCELTICDNAEHAGALLDSNFSSSIHYPSSFVYLSSILIDIFSVFHCIVFFSCHTCSLQPELRLTIESPFAGASCEVSRISSSFYSLWSSAEWKFLSSLSHQGHGGLFDERHDFFVCEKHVVRRLGHPHCFCLSATANKKTNKFKILVA